MSWQKKCECESVFSKQVVHRELFFIPQLIELERIIEKLDFPMILVV